MKLKYFLPMLHSSQFIKIYQLGKLMTVGFGNEIKNEEYLDSEIYFVYSEDSDSISIETK